jgi:hypothetical protein
MPAAFLGQQLQGEQTEQRTGGRDHTRAGILRLGHKVVESDTRQKREEEAKTGAPCASAASGHQRDPPHISHERGGWTDDGCAVVLPRRTTTGWGQKKGGHLLSPTLRAQVTDQATQGVIGIAQAFGDLYVGLVFNTHSP